MEPPGAGRARFPGRTRPLSSLPRRHRESRHGGYRVEVPRAACRSGPGLAALPGSAMWERPRSLGAGIRVPRPSTSDKRFALCRSLEWASAFGPDRTMAGIESGGCLIFREPESGPARESAEEGSNSAVQECRLGIRARACAPVAARRRDLDEARARNRGGSGPQPFARIVEVERRRKEERFRADGLQRGLEVAGVAGRPSD